jgi:hypothetical protein
MSHRLIVAMLGLGLALFLMPQVSLGEENHIEKAFGQTKVFRALLCSDSLGHAKSALYHLEAAEKVKANPDTEEAIKHLKQAIDAIKNGRDIASTHSLAAMNLMQGK